MDNNYKKFIRTLAEKQDPRTFLNSDEEHALDVFVEFFRIAKHVVRIFAGCLCKHVGNKNEYVVAISEFIERGGELKILLNDYDENAARVSSLYKRLAYYKEKGYPIEVRRTTAKPYLTSDPEKKPIHFTAVDDLAYRLETDIEHRTAECSFNNPSLAHAIADFFDSLFTREGVEEVDIVALFEHENQ